MTTTRTRVRSLIAPSLISLATIIAFGCSAPDEPQLEVSSPEVENYALPALAAQPNFASVTTEADIVATVRLAKTDPSMAPLRDALAKAGFADVEAMVDGPARYLSMLPGDAHRASFEEAQAFVKKNQDDAISAIKAEAAKQGTTVDWEQIDRETHLLHLTGQKREVMP